MKRSELQKMTKAELVEKFATPTTHKFSIEFEYAPGDPLNIWWCLNGGSDGTDSVRDTLARLLPAAIKEELAWALSYVKGEDEDEDDIPY
ncbi:unnamed protein product [marine sediment metagenome]|uniref:Uncharacterized protein n=1 Tax=marine sediment metagenome TaxID=412755 RepID=X0YF32_9ZZZZ